MLIVYCFVVFVEGFSSLYILMNQTACFLLRGLMALDVFVQPQRRQNFHITKSNSVPLHVLIIKIGLLKHNRL